MKMQCELLCRQPGDSTTAAEGVNHIKSMLGGGSPHRAGALKLALREIFLGGVFLRCPRQGCDLYNNTARRRSKLPGSRCPQPLCYDQCYLACAGCGSVPISLRDTSCRKCKKWFEQATHPGPPSSRLVEAALSRTQADATACIFLR